MFARDLLPETAGQAVNQHGHVGIEDQRPEGQHRFLIDDPESDSDAGGNDRQRHRQRRFFAREQSIEGFHHWFRAPSPAAQGLVNGLPLFYRVRARGASPPASPQHHLTAVKAYPRRLEIDSPHNTQSGDPGLILDPHGAKARPKTVLV